MTPSKFYTRKTTLRYLGLTSIGLILAQLVFGVIQVRWRYYQKVGTLREKIEDFAKELEIIAQDSPSQLKDSTLERLMRRRSAGDDITYGIIIDNQGQTISSFLNKEDTAIEQLLSDSQLDSLDFKNLIKTVKSDTKIREIRQPIIIAGESKGEIRIAYSLAQTKQETLKSAGKILTASVIVSLLLVIIIAVFFKREISQYLAKLVEENLTVIPPEKLSKVKSKDEFDQLRVLLHFLTKNYRQVQDLESQMAKNQFMAMIGHEIRTPLNAVTGMTGLLLDTPLNPQQKEFVTIIRNSGDNLLAMINNILDFSKITAQKLELEEQPFELGSCIEDVLRLFASQASQKQLELAYLIEPNTPRAIIGDSNRLRQILANLLGNALKFTETGEVVIYVSSKQLPHNDQNQENLPYEIRFAVKDTGIGIAPKHCERLFKPFSQVDASTTRKYGGTGLGLVISQRLSELMGGKMWVQSTEGKGSTFYFTIHAQASPSSSPAISQEGQEELMGKRMMIVDDNLTNRKILTLQAQSWGMFTCAVDSGTKALEWLNRDPQCDVAILDLSMPEIDGLELAQAIRRLPHCQNLPLIMLSSVSQQEMSQESDYSQFASVLMKPIQQSQLYESLMQIFAVKPVSVTQNITDLSEDETFAQRKPLKILVAEDVVVNQKVIALLLEKLGYCPDIVSDGREVLAALGRRAYDVILMDVRMPEMDGLTATRKISQELSIQQRPRIIAMTAEAMRGDRTKCLEAGMDDYISKPILLEELKQALSKCQPLKKQPSLDRKVLNSLRKMAGKQAKTVICDLIMGYFEDAPLRLLAINDAIAQEDSSALFEAAHALRSASANLGATELSKICQELETMGRTQQISEATDRLSAIKVEYDRVCLALKEELRQHCHYEPLSQVIDCENFSNSRQDSPSLSC
ncbi:MAG TPA: hybrid sensor histidine kinase/response regulator [Cyanothece sp. UBA12306]|nr:hybrid sensor histidine kinase/response regulator [Cyanothece sp. UBA12306]